MTPITRVRFATAAVCMLLCIAACGDDSKNDQAPAAKPGDAGDNMTGGKVSKPGEYRGYSERQYKGYELSSQYVAVRDGTKLALDLYRPKDASGKVVSARLPVLLMHTPDNRRYFETPDGMRGMTGETAPGAAAQLIEYGYVIAIADFRGMYASFGKNLGGDRGEWVEAARFDAYDLVEWLASQPWSSGKVGMWGCSASGGSQLQAATTAPPHLKAIFPMSCEFDAYAQEVPGGIAPPEDSAAPSTLPSVDTRNERAEPVDADKDKSQLMAAITSHDGSKDSVGYAPFRDSEAPDVPGHWWTDSSPYSQLDAINKSNIAVYVAANWDEGSTKLGAFQTFANLTTPKKMIIGPGTHCDWNSVEQQTGFDIAIEELRFFDHWLKDIDNGVMDEPAVTYYNYGVAKEQSWRTSDQWPLANQRKTNYYFGARTMTIVPPGSVTGKDDVKVDYDVTEDQLDKALLYETPYFSVDMQVTGIPLVDLFVSSTASDGDFVAVLQDVAQDGSAVSYHTNGRLRASHHNVENAPYNNLGQPWHSGNQADTGPLHPDEITELQIPLLPTSMLVKENHFIRVLISFSAGADTPKLDPAPTVTIHRDASHGSSLAVPIIPAMK